MNKYIKALEDGHKIKIYPDKNNEKIKNYDPAIFYKINNEYHTINKLCGDIVRGDLSLNKIKKHFKSMLSEGFILEVLQWQRVI